MTSKRYQLIGIGNAIVDVLAHVDDAFLVDNSVEKGVMTLIDTPRAEALYAAMGPAREISGGSAANTIAGFAALGGRAAYVGKIKDDQLGAIFAHDIRAQGADFDTPRALATVGGPATGRCMVLVTPDGERSMNTDLGVSALMGPDDIDAAMMADADWIYLEGYRFDGPDSKAAFRKAVRAAKAAGGRVALTVSDPFCIDRHRGDFLRLIAEDVDLLFANEHEIQSLYQADFNTAIERVSTDVAMAAITTGPRGALAISGGATIQTDSAPFEIVDTTGAGDLFAAGFFHGLTRGRDLRTCAAMGNFAAGEAISHIGARPETNLTELFEANQLG